MVTSQDPVIWLLQAAGNLIRKATIQILASGEMGFSQLLAACGLDYDHDTGQFCYHLSELIRRGLVEKTNQNYRLTPLGSKVAGILEGLDKECSSLFAETARRGEIKMEEREMEGGEMQAEWVEYGKEVQFEKRTEKGRMRADFHTRPALLRKRIAKELPEGTEKDKLLRFLDRTESWKGPMTVLIKDQDVPLAWAVVNSRIFWGDKPDKETGKPRAFAKTSLRAENITIDPWTRTGRKQAALRLFDELLDKARQMGADTVQLTGVTSEDSSTIQALRELGFQRTATSYNMSKTLQ